jgi:uncharacterized repeat protein (TIGR03803 family)
MKLFKSLLLAASLPVIYLIAVPAGGEVIFTNLVSFTGIGGACPGAGPYCGLVLGPDGNFYGTTSQGGSNNLGTIFQLTPDGVFTSLFSFNGTNGANPYAALTLNSGGVFYGTTSAGGVSNWGTIFLIMTNGSFTNLFSFAGTNNPWQGAAPAAALVPDGNGNFYGTANFGGTANALYLNSGYLLGYGYGTIFQLVANGTLTAPVVFGGTNGAHPSGGLVLAKDGNFYGTTTWGGNGLSGSFSGYGTIFKLAPDGTFTNIYKFGGFSDGGFVYAGLVQGQDGYLYGATFGGGSAQNGTLFKISTNGNFVPLRSFGFFESATPYAGMMQGSDGNLYGTTYGNALYGYYGSVFQLKPDGTYTNLFLFNSADGYQPAGVLVQGPDNNFYGTTSSGGANGFGTIFRLSVPMPAVIKAITLTNGAVTFVWSAVVGQFYQLQYSTNLSQWQILPNTKNFVATNGVITTTDTNAVGSAQRFYRVVLFP